MATSSVTPDGDAIVSEVHIAAAPDRIFQALVDPQQVPQWWGQGGVYRCTKFHADLRVGGKWLCEGIGPDGGNFEIAGEYLEINRPHLLIYTWVASWTGDLKTNVRWELEPTNPGTLLRIRHSGLGVHPQAAQSYRGWPRMLGWLEAFLDRGETVANRKQAATK